MKMTILKINDDEDTMDQVVKNEICWYEGLYQGWQWQEDGKIQNDKEEKEDDASYPLHLLWQPCLYSVCGQNKQLFQTLCVLPQ